MLVSPRNQIQSVDYPILKRGGPSSSDLLNRTHRRMVEDIVQLNLKVQDQDRKQQLLSTLINAQATGIQAVTAHLESLLPAAPANRGLADFYGTDYQGAGNTAYFDILYGQATLPIRSIQEKMSTTDTQGNLWVPEDSRLRYYISSTYTPGTFPPDDGYYSSLEDYLGIGNRSDSFFLGESTTGPAYVYLKAELPQSLNLNNLSNRVTFSILPSFVNTLVAIYIRDTGGSWTQLDVSYLPNISGSTVTFLGPTRIHFPPTEITQICLVLAVDGVWGVTDFGIQLVAYQPTATLAVDFTSYSPNPIITTIAHGKDAGVLNQYPVTIQGTVVSLSLSQIGLYQTPVVTGIEARW